MLIQGGKITNNRGVFEHESKIYFNIEEELLA